MSRDVSHLGEPPNIIRRTSSPLLVPGSKREEHNQIEEIRSVSAATMRAQIGLLCSYG